MIRKDENMKKLYLLFSVDIASSLFSRKIFCPSVVVWVCEWGGICRVTGQDNTSLREERGGAEKPLRQHSLSAIYLGKIIMNFKH